MIAASEDIPAEAPILAASSLDHNQSTILEVLATANLPRAEFGVARGTFDAELLGFGLERQPPGAAPGRKSRGLAIAASSMGAAYRSAIDCAAGSFDKLRRRSDPVIGRDESVVDIETLDWVVHDGGTVVVLGSGVVTARGSISDGHCFPVPTYIPVADPA